MIRLVMGTLVLLASGQTVLAQRWTAGFGQGTSEAIIRNRTGSEFNLYCPAGQENTDPGFFYQPRSAAFKTGQSVTVKLVVDGKDYTFTTEEGQFVARDQPGKATIRALGIALATSRAETFSIELPGLGAKETFSLRNAQKALGATKTSTILDECLQN